MLLLLACTMPAAQKDTADPTASDPADTADTAVDSAETGPADTGGDTMLPADTGTDDTQATTAIVAQCADAPAVFAMAADGDVADVTPAWTGTPDAPAAVILEDGATYLVCAGTWYVTLDDAGGTVAIVGESSRADTVLVGGAAARTVTSNGDLSIENLRIQGTSNAGEAEGGAIYTTGELRLSQVDVTGGVAEDGGLLWCGGCFATLTDVALRDGAANHGGAAWFLGGILVASGTRVTLNSATDGGAVYADTASHLTLSTSTLDGNDATGGGGAFWLGADSSADLYTSEVYGNAAATGGGARLDGDSALLIEGGTAFFDNVGREHGGGVWLSGSALTCYGAASTEGVFGNATDGVYLDLDSSVRSFGCDWTGTSDNAPADVTVSDGSTYSYGDDATFTL